MQWNVYPIKKIKWKKKPLFWWSALKRKRPLSDTPRWGEKRVTLGYFFFSNSDLFYLPGWPDYAWLMETKREDKKTTHAQGFSMALCTPLWYVLHHIEFSTYYYEWLICFIIIVPVTTCKNKRTAERFMCPTCCKSLVLTKLLNNCTSIWRCTYKFVVELLHEFSRWACTLSKQMLQYST